MTKTNDDRMAVFALSSLVICYSPFVEVTAWILALALSVCASITALNMPQ